MDTAKAKERIKELEAQIRKMPYHKGTEHHIGRLKARIAKLKDEMMGFQAGKGGGGGRGFSVRKEGDATVVLVGMPSVGKSTLINSLTNANSKVGHYPFTTLDVIPGMLDYKGAKIQIFDVPGMISGAASGRAGGKEIISVVRVTDLLILMAPAGDPNFKTMEEELSLAGVRVNEKKPEVIIEKKLRGGIEITGNPGLSKEEVASLAQEFRIPNAKIYFKNKLTQDQLIDAFMVNRVYVPAIKVVSKIDTLPKEKQEKLKKKLRKECLFISAEKNIGIEELKEKIFSELNFIRLYLRHDPQARPEPEPMICPAKITVQEAAAKISQSLAGQVKGAKIRGPSSRYPNQFVGPHHELQDEDQIFFVK